MLELLAHICANAHLDKSMRVHEFEVMGGVASSVPIRRLIPHRDGARLDELAEVIQQDLREINASGTAGVSE
jgi:hypothetical protein